MHQANQRPDSPRTKKGNKDRKEEKEIEKKKLAKFPYATSKICRRSKKT